MKTTLNILCESKGGVSLQQLPPVIREAIVPEKGNVFVSIDYSQMEYRVFAGLSGDPKLIEAINSGRDFHKEIAAQIFNKKYEDVSNQERKIGKVINLGQLYGMSNYGIARNLSISEEKAKIISEAYKKRFPEAMKWIESQKEKIKKEKKASTYFGRERRFDSTRELTNKEIDEGFNSIIQGTAADILKIGMVLSQNHLNKTEGKMVLSLHDELLFELPQKSAKEMGANLQEILNSAMPKKLKVNLKSDIAFHTKNWAEEDKNF
jgi:DNA polymerase-1